MKSMDSTPPLSIGIIGGGMAGLFAARALARMGHCITVLEPDVAGPQEGPDPAFNSWQRPHVPQLRLPHSARALIRHILTKRDPELYADLLANGMAEWRFQLEGMGPEAKDPELVGLLGRRPTFEVPLRRRVEETPGVSFRRTTVTSLVVEPGSSPPRVTGVRTRAGEELGFDLVIEATGRRSKIVEWLAELGVALPPELSRECGIVYYSRYFRFFPGKQPPQGTYPSGPAANLACVQYTMNRTDHGTFSLMFGTAVWEPIFKTLRYENVFMDVARRMPGIADWLDPELGEPIWRVEPFGGLTNRYRRYARDGMPLVYGLYVIGDARFHTNPIFGWGMALSLKQSYILADAFAEAADPAERQRLFERRIDDYARSFYDASAGEDEARGKMWRGELSGPQEPGSYEYYVTAVQPVAFKDPVIFRAVHRRLHLLDDPGAILLDDDVNRRAAAIPAPAKPLTRGDILAIVSATAEKHLGKGVRDFAAASA